MSATRILGSVVAAGIMVLAGTSTASAAYTVVVTPANPQGWSRADTRPGGTVTFVADPTSPYPAGALQLTTNATTTAKAQYLHPVYLPLRYVREAGYWTKQVSATNPLVADPSYQLVMCLNGGFGTSCNGFTTLVFEPYQNPLQGPIVPVPAVRKMWQPGLLVIDRSPAQTGVVAGTPASRERYTLDMIRTTCPNAIVQGFGVNIGSNNPGYVVRTDGFNFSGIVFDFQLTKNRDSND